ncbi:hypothetical protein OCAR_5536 [Afipia carboxidovorans OM5]|nr:hypothetical protein OCAR_5536 [Afipia carboxidovorans OM5]
MRIASSQFARYGLPPPMDQPSLIAWRSGFGSARQWRAHMKTLCGTMAEQLGA